MLVEDFESALTPDEMHYARQQLGREPTSLEWSMIDAEWSEHCSYKSSKPILQQLPTEGSRVLVGPGYDSGVVDIGDGYVLTLHIESHNHPSAIDPYGGAATGIGGVVRDILCMGTTPIALLDALKFGEITRSDHSKWILKNVVRGIADYGNCIGVPTVAGEIEFDECFERNCLVDVACLGLGKKDELLLAQATSPGDGVYLIGGSTGRDGIHGATFASRTLAVDAEKQRSAVQIPDPFTKKLIIEATLEASRVGLLRGCKDLGGGGLATGLSELADKGGTGIEVYLDEIPIRERDMSPIEILISESQERMLLVVKKGSEETLHGIVQKYGVSSSRIGEVTSTGTISIKRSTETLASLPTSFLANAPIILRNGRPQKVPSENAPPSMPDDLEKILLDLLASPTIASKEWVFRQYDHEVGVRTVAKPGDSDASVLKLPNGKFAAIKVDGNARICDLDPYVGGASVLAECCRNVTAVGAEPIAWLDHCQFGDPNQEEIFWAFSQAVKGMAEFARTISLPCVGGKVSFYNQDEDTGKAIRSSPVVAVLGLIDRPEHVTKMAFKQDDETIVAIGKTHQELEGSEYYHLLGLTGAKPPSLDFQIEKDTQAAILDCIRGNFVVACHDCSKGGLAIALAEMAITSEKGVTADLRELPRDMMRDDELLFSESNSRFLVSTNNPDRVLQVMSKHNVPAAIIGKVGGESLTIALPNGELQSSLHVMHVAYADSFRRILEPWLK
ncbi:MAG TPA: phosphoribosylformylglycinamidine synthase subunit PurL [Terriglobales bacterium]|nr:phosphoribosylformylglycinamidine synthase subunit PurL [Terriglobales bacterium]